MICLIFYRFLYTPHFYSLGSILLALFYRWINWSLWRLYYMCQTNNGKWHSLTVQVTPKFMLFPLHHITWPLPFHGCLAHLNTCKELWEIKSHCKQISSCQQGAYHPTRERKSIPTGWFKADNEASHPEAECIRETQKWSLVSVATKRDSIYPCAQRNGFSKKKIGVFQSAKKKKQWRKSG